MRCLQDRLSAAQCQGITEESSLHNFVRVLLCRAVTPHAGNSAAASRSTPGSISQRGTRRAPPPPPMFAATGTLGTGTLSKQTFTDMQASTGASTTGINPDACKADAHASSTAAAHGPAAASHTDSGALPKPTGAAELVHAATSSSQGQPAASATAASSSKQGHSAASTTTAEAARDVEQRAAGAAERPRAAGAAAHGIPRRWGYFMSSMYVWWLGTVLAAVNASCCTMLRPAQCHLCPIALQHACTTRLKVPCRRCAQCHDATLTLSYAVLAVPAACYQEWFSLCRQPLAPIAQPQAVSQPQDAGKPCHQHRQAAPAPQVAPAQQQSATLQVCMFPCLQSPLAAVQ